MAAFFLFFFLSATFIPLTIGQTDTISVVNCTAISPSWFDWGGWSSCSHACGGCGKQERQRICRSTSAACPCSGNPTESANCSSDSDPCLWPRQPCCSARTLTTGLDGRFACLTTSTGK